MFIIYDLKKCKRNDRRHEISNPETTNVNILILFLSYFSMNILFVDIQSDIFKLYIFRYFLLTLFHEYFRLSLKMFKTMIL